MSDNLPATRSEKALAKLPSLAREFEYEREPLRKLIINEGLQSQNAVRAAKIALEKTGQRFSNACEDVNLQRTGLWLLEMVKSGAGVLDTANKAEIILKKTTPKPAIKITNNAMFYGAALAFFLAGFVQNSRLAMLASIVLAGLKFFSGLNPKHLWRNIPLLPKTKNNRIITADGTNFQAEARISVEAGGFVDSLVEALKTADYILARLGEPEQEKDWTDDKRLVGFIQNLLEAGAAGDKDFAFKLVDSELASLLAGSGIEIIKYSKKTEHMFDILPAMDMPKGKYRQAAPALVKNGMVLRRGTVWKA